jgi:MFS family permease
MPHERRRWVLLALLTSAYGAGAFGVLGVSPLSPALLDAFALTRLEIGLILPATYVGGVLFSLPGGRLADRHGVRASLGAGLGAAGLFLALGAAAPGFASLLACLVGAGIGWSIVNPALGTAILGMFPAHERGLAMGIKQMGLMVGGVASALVLPAVALRLGWRAAIALCAVVAVLPFLVSWRTLARADRGRLERRAPGDEAGRGGWWWWVRRPALLVLFGSGLGFGMIQSAVLGYLPLFSIQSLGAGPVGAGVLLAIAQAGGACARLALGAVSDRWLASRRPPCLVATAVLGAAVFLAYGVARPSLALAGVAAFAAGVGSFGWVGLYLVASAEAGGPRQAGLLTGVGMAFILSGIMIGAPPLRRPPRDVRLVRGGVDRVRRHQRGRGDRARGRRSRDRRRGAPGLRTGAANARPPRARPVSPGACPLGPGMEPRAACPGSGPRRREGARAEGAAGALTGTGG